MNISFQLRRALNYILCQQIIDDMMVINGFLLLFCYKYFLHKYTADRFFFKQATIWSENIHNYQIVAKVYQVSGTLMPDIETSAKHLAVLQTQHGYICAK